MSAWFLLVSMLGNIGSCQYVNGERIFGEDLARALPVFSAMPPDAIVGYSPAPGARRIFPYVELKRIGARYRIPVAEDAQACFEWRLRSVSEAAIRAAVRESLHSPEARVEIVEMNHAPAPEGRVVFPLQGLSVSTAIDPATPMMWRGYIQVGKTRRYEIWARLRVTATMTRVVALEALGPGVAVEPTKVRLETYDDFPLRNDIARQLEEVVGRVPRRTIRPGPVLRGDLDAPFQVERGETVAVTAIAGAAQLKMAALAETRGRQGDVITLKNPQSGKRFRARVAGKGQAVVLAGGVGILGGME